MKIVVAGIGTEVGKTIVSAIFCEAFELNYWKPIQSGANEDNDSVRVSELLSKKVKIYPNSYCFKEPLSPDQAGLKEGITIYPSRILVPDSSNLLIEPAGGLMVPLTSDGFLFSDLLKIWNFPVVLVSRFYLGSINHTLLSIEFIKNSGLKLAGIIFTGEINQESKKTIMLKVPNAAFHHVSWTTSITKKYIQLEAEKLRNSEFQKLFYDDF